MRFGCWPTAVQRRLLPALPQSASSRCSTLGRWRRSRRRPPDTWRPGRPPVPLRPRHVLTWQEVPPGTSGAVTAAGLWGRSRGAVHRPLSLGEPESGRCCGRCSLALAASPAGCFLGATVQEQQLPALRRADRAAPPSLVAARRLLHRRVPPDNDMVNALSTALVGCLPPPGLAGSPGSADCARRRAIQAGGEYARPAENIRSAACCSARSGYGRTR